MTDATRKCPVCGAILPAKAKFCGECGTTLQPPTPNLREAQTAGQPGSKVLPWFLAGCGVLAVHAAVIILAVRARAPIGAPVQASAEFQAAPGSPGTGAPPDISNMTPRQAADRLYERIMRASEANDTAQVQF